MDVLYFTKPDDSSLPGGISQTTITVSWITAWSKTRNGSFNFMNFYEDFTQGSYLANSYPATSCFVPELKIYKTVYLQTI